MRQFLMVCAIILSATACNPPGSLEKAAEKIILGIDSAIATLDQNSGEWQSSLHHLQSVVANMGDQWVDHAQIMIRLAADHVDATLHNAIDATGTEAGCNTAIIGQKVRQELRYVRSLILRMIDPNLPPASEVLPLVCNTTPDAVTMEPGSRTEAVTWWGYNLANADIKIVLRHDDGEDDLTPYISRVENHNISLNTSSTTGAPLCNKTNR
jgi:hypothetical protein